MSKAPPIPPEQRAYNTRPDIEGEHQERRDARTDVQSGQPGDADVNLKEQGRFGNLKQNVASVQWKTQAR